MYLSPTSALYPRAYFFPGIYKDREQQTGVHLTSADDDDDDNNDNNNNDNSLCQSFSASLSCLLDNIPSVEVIISQDPSEASFVNWRRLFPYVSPFSFCPLRSGLTTKCQVTARCSVMEPDSCSRGRRIRHQSIKRKGQTQMFPHKTDDTNNLVEYSTSGICHRVTTSGSIIQQKEMSSIMSTVPHWKAQRVRYKQNNQPRCGYTGCNKVLNNRVRSDSIHTRRLKMLSDGERQPHTVSTHLW